MWAVLALVALRRPRRLHLTRSGLTLTDPFRRHPLALDWADVSRFTVGLDGEDSSVAFHYRPGRDPQGRSGYARAKTAADGFLGSGRTMSDRKLPEVLNTFRARALGLEPPPGWVRRTAGSE